MAPVAPVKVVLVGAKGMLAQMVARCAPPEYQIVPLDLPEFDLTDVTLVERTFQAEKPAIVINCAAFTQVDACETEEALAIRVNGDGPGNLARAALGINATLVHISTDYVFDGLATTPYNETDPTVPQSAYGRSKLLGEEAIRQSGLEKYFIVRTSWLYGPGGKNFVETILRLAAERDELRVVADQVGGPTFTGDLAQGLFNLLALKRTPQAANGLYGIYHFANSGQCSWYDFAREILTLAQERGLPTKVKQIVAIRTEDYPLPARRPAYSVFDSKKYQRVTAAKIPGWEVSLRTYFDIR